MELATSFDPWAKENTAAVKTCSMFRWNEAQMGAAMCKLQWRLPRPKWGQHYVNCIYIHTKAVTCQYIITRLHSKVPGCIMLMTMLVINLARYTLWYYVVKNKKVIAMSMLTHLEVAKQALSLKVKDLCILMHGLQVWVFLNHLMRCPCGWLQPHLPCINAL